MELGHIWEHDATGGADIQGEIRCEIRGKAEAVDGFDLFFQLFGAAFGVHEGRAVLKIAVDALRCFGYVSDGLKVGLQVTARRVPAEF